MTISTEQGEVTTSPAESFTTPDGRYFQISDSRRYYSFWPTAEDATDPTKRRAMNLEEAAKEWAKTQSKPFPPVVAPKPKITLESVAEDTFASPLPTPPTPLQITVLTPDVQVGVDVWDFRYERKAEQWKFWGIYRDGAVGRIQELGYFKRYRPGQTSVFQIHTEDNIIREVIIEQIADAFSDYVRSQPGEINQEGYQVTYEARSETLKKQSHLLFNDSFLTNLKTHTNQILSDTETTCFLPYQNGIVEVTAHGASLKPYTALDNKCVWASQVIGREFRPNAPTDCHFSQFVANVTNGEPDRVAAFRSAIGYVLHSYHKAADGQAVICCDEEITDRKTPQGGTGKGVFANAIRQLRPTVVLDGKKFDPSDKFCFQQVNEDTRMVWLDDPKADLGFDRFFSILTEGWTVEKKNRTTFTIPHKVGPKLLICSNHALNTEGSSNIRRQFILEFSDHYKRLIKPGQKVSPIIAEHGCTFFSEQWDADEWARFDAYMVGCAEYYMKHGQRPHAHRNVAQNRLRQTAGDDFFEWVTTYEETGLQPEQVYSIPELLTDFKAKYGIDDVKQRGFTNNLKRYATAKDWDLKRSVDKRSPGFTLLPKS